MAMNSISDLLDAVYEEIKIMNTGFGKDPVPLSNYLYGHLSKKFGIVESKVPQLLQMLVNSKMLFSLPVAENSAPGKNDKLFGYVVSRGNIVSALKKRYEENLEREYSHEFQKRVPAERLIREYSATRSEYNGKPFGIALNMAMMLDHNQKLLEKSILQFSDKAMKTALDDEIKNSDPLSSYLKTAPAQNDNPDPELSPVKAKAKPAEAVKSDEIRSFSVNHSVEKSLKLYGVEMYTRLCFRDYQFKSMCKIIEDGQIREKNDLLTVKKMLDAKRMTADTDPKINDCAADINALQKAINEAIKKSS